MRGKILIVDDEQLMCEMLEDDLKRLGFNPTCYNSAEKAFNAPDYQRPDCQCQGLAVQISIVANQTDLIPAE